MMEWVLFLWLSRSPDVLVPVGFFNAKAECLTAKREEINMNVRMGMGGGATYVCLPNR